MRLVAFALCAVVGGCSTFIPKTKVVEVPVPVACVSKSPDKPVLVTDEELKAMNDYQLPLALFRDREQRQVYENTLEAIVEVCK